MMLLASHSFPKFGSYRGVFTPQNQKYALLLLLAVCFVLYQQTQDLLKYRETREKRIYATRNHNTSLQSQKRYLRKFIEIATTRTYSCKSQKIWGGTDIVKSAGTGAKRLCIDADIEPEPDNCLVYSFGIGEDWSFDEDALQNGCDVYSFDPFIRRRTSSIDRNIKFYHIALFDRTEKMKVGDNNIQVMCFDDIVDMLKHKNMPIDVVKMNIEWSEWDVLPQMIKNGSLSHVKQLLVEVHSRGFYKDHFMTLRGLEHVGMALFDWVWGNCPQRMQPCFELSYVNKKYL